MTPESATFQHRIDPQKAWLCRDLSESHYDDHFITDKVTLDLYRLLCLVINVFYEGRDYRDGRDERNRT